MSTKVVIICSIAICAHCLMFLFWARSSRSSRWCTLMSVCVWGGVVEGRGVRGHQEERRLSTQPGSVRVCLQHCLNSGTHSIFYDHLIPPTAKLKLPVPARFVLGPVRLLGSQSQCSPRLCTITRTPVCDSYISLVCVTFKFVTKNSL